MFVELVQFCKIATSNIIYIRSVGQYGLALGWEYYYRTSPHHT